MFPVSSSDPAMMTRTRPRLNTAPVSRVVTPPQIAGSRPAVTSTASSPAKAM